MKSMNNENMNEVKSHKVPIYTFEEYLEMIEKKEKMKGPYKICEEDTEKFLKYIANR